MKRYFFLLLLLSLVVAADFNITTTADFDAGVKTDVETVTDYIDVPANQLQLKYGDVFADNFDSEAEGTSPPVNWVADFTYPPDTLEVDDIQYKTSPHSMLMVEDADSLNVVHHNVDFTSEPYEFYIYIEKTTAIVYITTQSTAGNYDSTKHAALISFRNTGDIMYYDGAWQDTGYDYTTGWHKLKIIHDFPNDQFDAWYDGTQIIDNGGFRNTAASGASLQLGFDPETTGTTNIWFDDIKLGDYYTTGNWNSTNQTMTAGSNMASTTLNYTGVDASNYIDMVEWIVGGVVKANYTTDITSGTSTTITTPTGGSFADVNADFTIKVYLAGNNLATPTITEISGTYATTYSPPSYSIAAPYIQHTARIIQKTDYSPLMLLLTTLVLAAGVGIGSSRRQKHGNGE